MKKAILFILLLLCFMLTACGRDMAVEPGTPAQSVATEQATSPIDLDLSSVSTTIAYAQVYEMFVNPNDYIGKRISIRGSYYNFTDPNTGQVYTAVIITDNTACCELGLEFILGGGCAYPEDYPTVGDTITVTGIFYTYMEGEHLYCHLTDSMLD